MAWILCITSWTCGVRSSATNKERHVMLKFYKKVDL